MGTSDCPDNSNCIDIPGSFICQCKHGFESVGDECNDIDECTIGTDGCSDNDAECENDVGGFSCVCDEGFAFDNDGLCLNINECAIGTDSCDPVSEVGLGPKTRVC